MFLNTLGKEVQLWRIHDAEINTMQSEIAADRKTLIENVVKPSKVNNSTA